MRSLIFQVDTWSYSGGPGSGKSTLLTQRLRGLDTRLISYYAYVPDSAHSHSSRGESVNFLHDVVLQLDRAGFQVGGGANKFDRELLRERLHEQLSLLHLDWKETGTKTVILVDGLDHIDRETASESIVAGRPSRS